MQGTEVSLVFRMFTIHKNSSRDEMNKCCVCLCIRENLLDRFVLSFSIEKKTTQSNSSSKFVVSFHIHRLRQDVAEVLLAGDLTHCQKPLLYRTASIRLFMCFIRPKPRRAVVAFADDESVMTFPQVLTPISISKLRKPRVSAHQDAIAFGYA